MSQLDLLILVVYIIVVILVVNRAIESLDNRTSISFIDARFKDTLEQYGLTNQLGISFAFANRYSFNNQPKELNITIQNMSDDSIYVDWDRSSINNSGGPSQRTVRLTPYSSPDLSKPQVYTVIPPGSSVQELITAEDALTSPDENNPQILQPTQPIMTPGGMTTLWLICQIDKRETVRQSNQLYVLPCDIISSIMPWTDSLPWK